MLLQIMVVEWRIYNQNPNDPTDDTTKEVGCTRIVLIVKTQHN